jgi:enoyl-CoA hydratase
MFDTILITKTKQYNIIQLNRKEAKNAINKLMINELTEAISLSGEEQKHIVFTGYNDVFSAGGDIKLMSTINTKQEAVDVAKTVQKLMLLIENYPYITISAINGLCFGGGLELALACDFIFASKKAFFAMPELNYDIIPGSGGCIRLPKKISYQKTFDILLTGKTFDAKKALDLNIVDKIFDDENFLNHIDNYISNIKTNNYELIKILKTTLKSGNYNMEAENFGFLLNKYGTVKIKKFFENKNKINT